MSNLFFDPYDYPGRREDDLYFLHEKPRSFLDESEDDFDFLDQGLKGEYKYRMKQTYRSAPERAHHVDTRAAELEAKMAIRKSDLDKKIAKIEDQLGLSATVKPTEKGTKAAPDSVSEPKILSKRDEEELKTMVDEKNLNDIAERLANHANAHFIKGRSNNVRRNMALNLLKFGFKLGVKYANGIKIDEYIK